MNATTSAGQNQFMVAPTTRRTFAKTAFALVATPLAVAAAPVEARISDLEVAREEIEALCVHMTYLRSWWATYGDSIRSLDRQAAYEVHDHFVDGVIFAGSIAKMAGFDLQQEKIKDYSWGIGPQAVRMVKVDAA